MKNLINRACLYKNAFIQFIKFSMVGVLNTAVFYAGYFLLLRLGVFYPVALTVATTVGIANSYVLNRIFTFKSKEKVFSQKIKFVAVYAIQWLFNLLAVVILVQWMSFSPEIAGLIALVPSVCISFFGHKFWTFR